MTYILSAGGNPNPVSPDNTLPSPLHYAVSEGYRDCAQTLVEAGANVNAFIITDKVCQNRMYHSMFINCSFVFLYDKTALTPLDYAQDYPEIKELLLSNNALPGKDIDVPKPPEEEEE